jgi:hypothetical protein
MLTEQQIRASASLTGWKTRQAVANLVSRKLIVTGARRGRYEITQLGRNTLAAKASGFGRLGGATFAGIPATRPGAIRRWVGWR